MPVFFCLVTCVSFSLACVLTNLNTFLFGMLDIQQILHFQTMLTCILCKWRQHQRLCCLFMWHLVCVILGLMDISNAMLLYTVTYEKIYLCLLFLVLLILHLYILSCFTTGISALCGVSRTQTSFVSVASQSCCFTISSHVLPFPCNIISYLVMSVLISVPCLVFSSSLPLPCPHFFIFPFSPLFMFSTFANLFLYILSYSVIHPFH